MIIRILIFYAIEISTYNQVLIINKSRYTKISFIQLIKEPNHNKPTIIWIIVGTQPRYDTEVGAQKYI